MDPGDYVITFNGGLVQETATGKELIKDLLDYEDYLDIESLANKLQIHSHAITKDGIYTSRIAISDATPFMNLNWSICPFITGRLKKFVRKNCQGHVYR